jgi:hypothetical protein
LESFQKGVDAEAAVVMGDIPNFSSEKPLIVKGNEVPRASK